MSKQVNFPDIKIIGNQFTKNYYKIYFTSVILCLEWAIRALLISINNGSNNSNEKIKKYHGKY